MSITTQILAHLDRFTTRLEKDADEQYIQMLKNQYAARQAHDNDTYADLQYQTREHSNASGIYRQVSSNLRVILESAPAPQSTPFADTFADVSALHLFFNNYYQEEIEQMLKADADFAHLWNKHVVHSANSYTGFWAIFNDAHFNTKTMILAAALNRYADEGRRRSQDQ